jgi:hypothetical protein
MASLADNVRCNVSGIPGTGDVTVGTAATGFQTFAQGGVMIGDSVRVRAEDGANWEIIEGSYTAGGIIKRNTVSSNLNTSPPTPVSLSSGTIISLVLISDDIDYLFCAAQSA